MYKYPFFACLFTMVSDEMKNGIGSLCFLPGIVISLIPCIAFPAFAVKGGHGVTSIRMKLPITFGWTPSLERIMAD